jgi:hypothetical protein
MFSQVYCFLDQQFNQKIHSSKQYITVKYTDAHFIEILLKDSYPTHKDPDLSMQAGSTFMPQHQDLSTDAVYPQHLHFQL